MRLNYMSVPKNAPKARCVATICNVVMRVAMVLLAFVGVVVQGAVYEKYRYREYAGWT